MPSTSRSAPKNNLLSQGVSGAHVWNDFHWRCRCGQPFLIWLTVLAALPTFADGPPVPRSGREPQAPPPAPPIQVREPSVTPEKPPRRPLGPQTIYSVGQPTDEEQLYLEYLNRMRADPTAEGQRLATTTDPNVLSAYTYFNVDLSLMQTEFSTNPAVAPLAMNEKLLAAARWHSGDMFTNQYQGHYQTNGTLVLDPGERMKTNGYNWASWGENVYAYAESVPHGHAGFAVDWGAGAGGMQNPAGHRHNMLSASFREVGMGVVDGVNGSVGPELITQDFGAQVSDMPFITGVVYYDFNSNGFYDSGEGIGGVTVSSPGSAYYAVTADSGGFALPVSSNGNYAVTFSASGLSNLTMAAVSNLKNVKIDFMPLYTPPMIVSGPNPASVNHSNYYTFSAVGAATGYQWQLAPLVAYTAVEGAENGLVNVTVVSDPGYSVIVSDVVYSGSHSFHLAMPNGDSQYLRLNPVLRPSASSQLSFAKRLGWASSDQIAKAQVSADGGQSWQDVWSEPGSNSSGESGFSTVTVSLSSYADENIQVRFGFVYFGGNYYPQTDAGVGLYLDDIAISGAEQVQSATINNVLAGTSFSFFPTNPGTYLAQVRARINSRTLAWGPATTIVVGNPPPSIQIVSAPAVAAGQVHLDFTIEQAPAGITFKLWKTADVASGWSQDSSAVLQTLVPNSKFRFTTSSGGAAKTFYTVIGSY